MNSRANRRVAQLAGHLTPAPAALAQISDLVLQPTAASGPLLHNQVAIVTGSGQGVGAATAKLFASEGASVVVSDLDAAKANQVAQEIRAAGGKAIVVVGDVTSEEFPQRVVDATIKAFGALHILVNNAGFTWDAVIHKTTVKQWETMFAVHCTAPFRLIQAAEPYMRGAAKDEMTKTGKAAPRVILNVSSTSGVHGNSGQSNYSTAKMGIVGLTKTVAKEWGGFNIRCNAVVYGTIKTRLVAAKEAGAAIHIDGQQVALGIPGVNDPDAMAAMSGCPLKRAGTPEEAAGAMLMLACNYSSYISGQAIEVTGGSFL